MVNPDQKTILLEQAYDDIRDIYTKFQKMWSYRYGSKNSTQKLSRVWERDIDDDFYIDWEV